MGTKKVILYKKTDEILCKSCIFHVLFTKISHIKHQISV